MTQTWEIREGDCREVLALIDAESVQTVVTSPPYYGLRDYGHDGQIGLEASPDEFVAALVGVFRDVRRVLRDDGTVWLNLGDSYAGSWGAQSRGGPPSESSTLRGNGHVGGGPKAKSLSAVQIAAHPKGQTRTGSVPKDADYKPKDLLGIPWLVAFALRADGWYLRADIIWHKPNPMPESVRDRPTRAHEFIFLLSKSPRYYYDADAIREDDKGMDHPRKVLHRPEPSGGVMSPHQGIRTGANKRDVWTISSKPFSGSHFATFPPDLIEPCILAGCPERACAECGAPWERIVEREPTRPVVAGKNVDNAGVEPSCACAAGTAPGIVLDPFAGAGTTGVVALRHGRSFLGVELNPNYAAMARARIADDAPLLNGACLAAASTPSQHSGEDA